MAAEPAKRISHEPPRITILSDHPAQDRDRGTGIGEVEHIADRDLLTLESRLSPVFDILRHKNTRSPLTIAIYGTWGTGKTSAMRWLETRLGEWNDPKNKARDGHPKVHPIWFDPWRYHTREEVWRGIIAEVILALFSVETADRQTIGPRLVQAAKKFGAFLGRGFIAALASIKVKVKAGIPGLGEAEIGVDGEAARDIWDEYEKANHPEKAHLNQFEDTLRSWVRDFMPRHKEGTDSERIAIFIDDLDRCLPDVTLEVLEALKLYLNIPSLIFVVGLDREVVDAVVANEYSKNKIPIEKARSYLDKIFQVDLTIPPSEAQMGGFVGEQLKALNKAASGYWHDTLHKSGHRERIETALAKLAENNPREVKRVLNSALIRGRTAALDATLDAKLGTSDTQRALRFAQGIQVFLLQRLVRNSVEGSEKLLIGKGHIAWFRKASELAIASVGGRDPDVYDGASLTRKLIGLRPDPLDITPRHEQSSGVAMPAVDSVLMATADLYNHLDTNLPTRDNGSAIDAGFWEKPLLWEILLIPFSEEVTQSAPKLEAPTPAPVPPDTLLAKCPPTMRERLAAAAQLPVILLNADSLVGMTGLDLRRVELNPAGLQLLGRLTQLRRLSLGDTELSDLSALAGFNQLQELYLDGTPVSDLSALAGLTQLQELYLHRTQVSEISALAGLTQLKRLCLNETQVSDVRALEGLTQLKRLDLVGVQVSKEQVAALEKALPNLQIVR